MIARFRVCHVIVTASPLTNVVALAIHRSIRSTKTFVEAAAASPHGCAIFLHIFLYGATESGVPCFPPVAEH